ncbi:hypothetical protein G7Z17_g4053 [Cylindrodendrum hubeiense]|uniref:Uncharacterized protein n=1 Tax=Cylindrodendrum hubeiense TaxID=595255 RepID=A0A9P5HDH9_9HYPO|nr:hypothetical protein G7Z17_g4053 [Cylindrodendrum hubeiense]
MRVSATLSLLALLEAVSCQSIIGFGPAFSLGPTNSWIREATTTLVLPKVPSPQLDRLALWPGMGTSGGDLIQALAVSFSDPNANCGATAGQWYGTQLGGTQVPASAGDEVTMHYKYNDSTGKYDQTAALNGKVVSTLSTSSGNAQGWGTAVECQDDACVGTVVAHKYTDTTIILNAIDTTFKDTLVLTEATSSGFSTTDGGKTWTVDTINIQAHTYDVTS